MKIPFVFLLIEIRGLITSLKQAAVVQITWVMFKRFSMTTNQSRLHSQNVHCV